MSGRSKLNPHHYKTTKYKQRNAQHNNGHSHRNNVALNAINNINDNNKFAKKHKNVTIDKSKLKALTSKLDNKLAKKLSKYNSNNNHNKPIQHITRNDMIQNATQCSNSYIDNDNNSNNDIYDNDNSIVRHKYYFKELKKIIEQSDILLEVC